MADGTKTVGAEAATAQPERLTLGYHASLDGIRAVAVLSVIAFHFDYAWAQGGYLGVDMFFVLSGFLITTLLVLELRRTETIGLAAFWARRARRLLPALAIVLCFVGLYALFVIGPADRALLRPDMLSSAFYVANWHFILDKQAFSWDSLPLRHMWSLAIEEQYYFLWPLIVLACLRLARGSLRLLAGVCCIGAAASIITMGWRYAPGFPPDVYYATDARAHTLFAGALLALVLVRWSPSPRGRRLLVAASTVAAAAVVIVWREISATDSSYYHGGSALFAALGAVIIAGALQPGRMATLLSFKPLVWIGQISYGLYLWHWPVDVWLVPPRVPLSATALNALRLTVTFAAASISFYVVERPIRERAWRSRSAIVATDSRP